MRESTDQLTHILDLFKRPDTGPEEDSEEDD